MTVRKKKNSLKTLDPHYDERLSGSSPIKITISVTYEDGVISYDSRRIFKTGQELDKDDIDAIRDTAVRALKRHEHH